jgi:hypothetical protein
MKLEDVMEVTKDGPSRKVNSGKLPPDHLLLDSAPNIGPLISHWELHKFKNC